MESVLQKRFEIPAPTTVTVVLLALFCFLDAYFTGKGIGMGFVSEANPLLQNISSWSGWLLFGVIKAGWVLLFGPVVIRSPRLLMAVTGVYSLLLLYHLAWIVRAYNIFFLVPGLF